MQNTLHLCACAGTAEEDVDAEGEDVFLQSGYQVVADLIKTIALQGRRRRFKDAT